MVSDAAWLEIVFVAEVESKALLQKRSSWYNILNCWLRSGTYVLILSF